MGEMSFLGELCLLICCSHKDVWAWSHSLWESQTGSISHSLFLWSQIRPHHKKKKKIQNNSSPAYLLIKNIIPFFHKHFTSNKCFRVVNNNNINKHWITHLEACVFSVINLAWGWSQSEAGQKKEENKGLILWVSFQCNLHILLYFCFGMNL